MKERRSNSRFQSVSVLRLFLMFLLVTTSHAVLTVDIESRVVSVVHKGEGLYYGVCRYKAGLAIAARRRLTGDDSDLEEERGNILHFDFALADTHMISSSVVLLRLYLDYPA